MRKLVIVLVLVAANLQGCTANGFSKYYRSVKTISNPDVQNPQIRSSYQYNDDCKNMEEGYVLLGYSNFYGPKQSESQVRQKAKQVGADVVLVEEKYRNTRSGATPLTLPYNQTSHTTTTGSGTIRDTYDWSNSSSFDYSSYSTTTTPGFYTTYIPYHVDIFDYRASFWAIKQE